jgi:hypothetical protein
VNRGPVASGRPPEAQLGALLSLHFLLVRSSKVAVRAQHFMVYEEGFEFELAVRFRADNEPWDPMYGLAGVTRKPDGQLPIEDN